MRLFPTLQRRFRVALLSLGLLIPSVVHAQNTPAPTSTEQANAPLELRAVLASVERSFPLLRAAELDRDAAEGQLQTARGGFDPTLRVRGAMTPTGPYTYGYFDATVEQPTPLWGASFFAGYRLGQAMTPWGVGTAEIPVYDGRLQTNEGGELRAGVTVPLWRDGPIDRRRAELTRAELGLRVSELTVAQQRIEYARLASLRYWDWVLSGARVRIARELLELAQTRNAQLEQRAQRGDIPSIDRTDNARAVQARLAAVIAAVRALEQASIELSLYLRNTDGAPSLPAPTRLPASLPELPAASTEPSPAQALDVAYTQRPELPRLQTQREQSEVDARFARNQLAPGINVTLSVAQDLGAQSTTRARTEVTGGVAVDIPIPNRAAQGRIRSAEATMARVQEQLRFARNRIEADVRDAYSALQAARTRREATRVEVQLAREVEQGERTRFEAGDSTMLLLNLREVATAEARLREQEALADYQRALVLLRAAQGQYAPE